MAKHRGFRRWRTRPELSEEQILAWADAYFAAQGKWPAEKSGPIPGTRETWQAVSAALYRCGRGLQRRISLSQLLAQRRGPRNIRHRSSLEEQQILAWAKAYFNATGRWPRRSSGPILQSPEDKWSAVDYALSKGTRGLPRGSSLAKLLRKHGLGNRRTRRRRVKGSVVVLEDRRP